LSLTSLSPALAIWISKKATHNITHMVFTLPGLTTPHTHGLGKVSLHQPKHPVATSGSLSCIPHLAEANHTSSSKHTWPRQGIISPTKQTSSRLRLTQMALYLHGAIHTSQTKHNILARCH
jgi:hypothetical protein